MAKIKCLQVGNSNWASQYEIPEHVDWFFLTNEQANQELKKRKKSATKKEPMKKYNVLLLTEAETLKDFDYLIAMMDYYTILYDPSQITDSELKFALEKKLAHKISLSSPEKIVEDIGLYFFKGQYGHRLPPRNLIISPNLPGKYWRDGMHKFIFEGDYGQEWIPLASYREPLHSMIDAQKNIRMFLEFDKTDEIDIKVVVTTFNMYSGMVNSQEEFTEDELINTVEYGPCEPGIVANFNIFIKGKGRATIGNLQIRYSRGPYGEFTLGAKRDVDEHFHELISYLYPADYKPPLCVYFGGYRKPGGFEGYGMMKALKSPFMLFEDSSVEGGGFYRGTPEFEQKIVQRIQEALDFLGFTNKDLVLSGFSMGTHAAMYYGAELAPSCIVVNKPIANFQPIINNYQLKGVGVFPTGLDVTKIIMEQKNFHEVSEIDKEFWEKFGQGKLLDTKFYVTHMKNEDYDDQVFVELVDYFLKHQKMIYSKGIPGRHNDNQGVSVSSFTNFYHQVLIKEFHREG
ncbi:accessory Sec system protein Asp2 [Enterococcus cecorum]|uniref:accessory Sec system protein Asp2 n=1 Tax=Enterococcus cecorum TaxID=44008 RepID=UPI0025A3CC55|nr:accessory Sec system protein Asp2 [Enterococcus cecorum]MDM8182631.1 accessory Sec system protein Asp2 [Enterococcus cecorum]